MLAEGIAGRFFQKLVGNATARLTGLGSLGIAQVEGEGDEATRAGIRFHMAGLGATGIAPVQAMPSTAAQWLIYNPAANLLTAFVDVIGEYLVSGTAGAGAALLACIVKPAFVPTTIPVASTAGVSISNANPVSAKASNLIVVSAQTLQGAAAGNWFPIGEMNPAVTAIGTATTGSRDVRGKFVIPPGCGIGLAMLSPTGTTPLFVPYASWREYLTDLE